MPGVYGIQPDPSTVWNSMTHFGFVPATPKTSSRVVPPSENAFTKTASLPGLVGMYITLIDSEPPGLIVEGRSANKNFPTCNPLEVRLGVTQGPCSDTMEKLTFAKVRRVSPKFRKLDVCGKLRSPAITWNEMVFGATANTGFVELPDPLNCIGASVENPGLALIVWMRALAAKGPTL
jgi:hypothetical protein